MSISKSRINVLASLTICKFVAVYLPLQHPDTPEDVLDVCRLVEKETIEATRLWPPVDAEGMAQVEKSLSFWCRDWESKLLPITEVVTHGLGLLYSVYVAVKDRKKEAFGKLIDRMEFISSRLVELQGQSDAELEAHMNNASRVCDAWYREEVG